MEDFKCNAKKSEICPKKDNSGRKRRRLMLIGIGLTIAIVSVCTLICCIRRCCKKASVASHERGEVETVVVSQTVIERS